MNLTLAVDATIVERARKAAAGMGITLNQAIRRYLEHLAGAGSAEEEIRELAELSRRSTGRSAGWRFDRGTLHERS